MFHVDESKRVVMKLGFAWAVLAFIAVSAFYLGIAVSDLRANDKLQDREILDHENRIKAVENSAIVFATNSAVINEKLDTIQRDLAEMKATQKEQGRVLAGVRQ